MHNLVAQIADLFYNFVTEMSIKKALHFLTSATTLFIIASVFFVAGITARVAFAGWVDPPENPVPPNGGTAPINVANVDQAKTGGLYVAADTVGQLFVGVQAPDTDTAPRLKINGAGHDYGIRVQGANDRGVYVSVPAGSGISPFNPVSTYGGFFEAGGVSASLAGIYTYAQPAGSNPAYGLYAQVGNNTDASGKSYAVYGKAGEINNGAKSYGIYGDTGAANGTGEVYGIYGVNTASGGVGRAANFNDTVVTTNPTVEISSQSAETGLKVTQNATGSALRLAQNNNSYDYLAAYIDGRVRIAKGTNDDHVGNDMLGVYSQTPDGSALYIQQNSGVRTAIPGLSGNAYGIYSSGGGVGIYAKPQSAGGGSKYAIYGESLASTGGAQYGIYGKASGATAGGQTYAVVGEAGSVSDDPGTISYGVYGTANGASQYGVYGINEGTDGSGIYGVALDSSSVALRSENTEGGLAAYFKSSGAALSVNGQSFFTSTVSPTINATGSQNVIQITASSGTGLNVISTNPSSYSVKATGNILSERSLYSQDIYLQNNGSGDSKRMYLKDIDTDPKICVDGATQCDTELLNCPASHWESMGIVGSIGACLQECASLDSSDYQCDYDCNGDVLNECTGGTPVQGGVTCTDPGQYNAQKISGIGYLCSCEFTSDVLRSYQLETFSGSSTSCTELDPL